LSEYFGFQDNNSCHRIPLGGVVKPSVSRRVLACLAVAGLVSFSGKGFAQSPDAVSQGSESETGIETAAGVTTYVPAFFAEANPVHARDMINRLPGFSFNGGSNTRGFAGSAGNVLIDGAVSSTKSVSLNDVLQRIPAGNVERIEVIRGGAPGIDMQGFPVVANVVRKTSSTTSGALEATPGVNETGDWNNRGRAEISHRTDHFSFDGALTAETNAFGGNGTGGNTAGFQARYDRFGNLRDSGRFIVPGYESSYGGNGVAEYRHDWLGTFRFNGSANFNKDRLDSQYYAVTPQGVMTLRSSPSNGRTTSYELGADYEGDFYGTRATVLGLYRRAFPVNSSSNPSTGTVSGNRAPNGETIAQTTLRHELMDWVTLQVGAEGALNFRDTTSFLTLNGVPQVLPNANVRVEEERAELSATANIAFLPELRAEIGMRYETSVIKQLGDTNRQRAFTFGKPRAIFNYDIAEGTQLRLRMERRVGQLDFSSFAAANDLVLGTVTAGNANLEPERSWEYEIALEQRFWGKGAITLAYLHADVEKINDRIVIIAPTGIFDAPGNIGDGTRDSINLDATIPFDRLGLTDFRTVVDLSWNWADLIDPVTGVRRAASNASSFGGNVTLIQDVPAWNSTFSFQLLIQPRYTNYLLRELRVEDTKVHRQVIAWTWQAMPDLQLKFQAENPLRRERERVRTLYTTSRAVGDLSGYENQRTTSRPVFRLTMRKTF
jgi:outer membrane receptor protein involved in Fe transport